MHDNPPIGFDTAVNQYRISVTRLGFGQLSPVVRSGLQICITGYHCPSTLEKSFQMVWGVRIVSMEIYQEWRSLPPISISAIRDMHSGYLMKSADILCRICTLLQGVLLRGEHWMFLKSSHAFISKWFNFTQKFRTDLYFVFHCN